MGNGYARRIRVIDRRLQYGLIALFLFIVLAGLLIVAALTVTLALAFGGPQADIASRLAVILPPLLINDIAIMVLIIVVGISATHRIAGPVYRIESDIDRILSGERGVRIHCRSRDAFPDLAEKVNKLIERIDGTQVI